MSVDVFDEASLDPLLIKIVKNLQDMGLESTVLAYSSHHSLLPPPRRPLSFAIYRLIALEVFRILIREDSVHDVSDLCKDFSQGQFLVAMRLQLHTHAS